MKKAAQALIERLSSGSMTVATAESCTGGMIGEVLTSVPGASGCYGFGFITYANEAKENLLGVSHQTLDSHGAVSPQTACEMAEGALRVSSADIAISVTGIAGPGGGSAQKPVGLVYIGIASAGTQTVAYKNNFGGDRDAVRRATVKRALELALEALEKERTE